MTEYKNTKQKRPDAGEWIRMPKKLKIGCCDCGLIHDFEFKITTRKNKKPKLRMRVWRDDPMTAEHRKTLETVLK